MMEQFCPGTDHRESKECLEKILDEFLNHAKLPEEKQKENEAYLKRRIRPAVELLMEREDLSGLERLAETGWFGRRELEGFLDEARKKENQKVLLFLMHLKNRKETMNQKADSSIRQESGRGEEKQEDEVGKETLARNILALCRETLTFAFPDLDAAFAVVETLPDSRTATMGTDGEFFFYCPDFLIQSYAKSPERVQRGYLHLLLHCLFLHPMAEVSAKTDQEKRLWHFACDLAVERVLDGEKKEEIEDKTILAEQRIRKKAYDWIFDGKNKEKEGLSAEKIYEMLITGPLPEGWERWETASSFDDPSLWNRKTAQRKREKQTKKWEEAGSFLSAHRPGGKWMRGTSRGSRKETVQPLEKSRFDYRRFLEQFMTEREEVRLDLDQFDPVFYHFGMEHYGNIPLIEPLEVQEGNRLSELVIAIDTSGSCKKETVQRFLGETKRILTGKGHFFQKMNVCLIQCDCFVQSVVFLHSLEEWEDYSRQIVIEGRSGTDFRPVFACVETLRKEKRLKNPGALLYFTDGDGIYPESKPDYETAFVFLKETEHLKKVPGWARTLIVEE